MLRGMYGAAAGMIAQQQRQEMLTNNLANVQTAGFKAEELKRKLKVKLELKRKLKRKQSLS